MKIRTVALSLVTLTAPLVLLSASVAEAHRPMPDAPYIISLDRSCTDGSTMLYLEVLRYNAKTHEWGPAAGVQTLEIEGRGGSPDSFHDWTAFAKVTTDPSDGGGWLGWEKGATLPFQMRLVLPDGTKSEEIAQPDGCVDPA